MRPHYFLSRNSACSYGFGMNTFTHIAVLQGGWSAEREVSLTSGKAVVNALRELNYQVTAIDAVEGLAARLVEAKPDAVFNALHGHFGEDGCVQGLLEMLKIPYTHSGVRASANAMHKPTAKQIFIAHGIPVTGGDVFTREAILKAEPMPRPYVIKPVDEGSSVGVQIMYEDSDAIYDAENWPFGLEVLIEPYVAGREIQVAVLDGKALGAIEIKPLGKFYDYEAKYTHGKAQHLMPAPLSEAETATVCAFAEQAHNALGCRGLTRSDFRLDDNGQFYLMETNTQPGMTPLSLAPEIAAYSGISFNQLVDRLIRAATLDSTPKIDTINANNKTKNTDTHGETQNAKHAHGPV